MRFVKRAPAKTLGIAIIYFLLARLGLQFATINHSASPVWPASGFAIGMMIVFGPRHWLGIFLGATAANLLQGTGWPCAFAIGVGNTLEASCGAMLYKLIKRSEARYGPLVEAFAVFAASIFGSVFSPTVGISALMIAGEVSRASFPMTWMTWWSGDSIGGLFVVPLVLAVRFRWEQEHGRFWRGVHPVAVLQLLGGALAAAALTGYGDGSWYLCLAMLLLLGMTAGKRGAEPSLAAVTIALVGIAGIGYGFGPFRSGSINDNLLNLQLFLSSVAVTVLFLKAFLKLGPLRVPGLVLAAGSILGALITFHFVKRSETTDQLSVDRIIAESSLRIDERIDSYRRTVDAAGAFVGAVSDESIRLSAEEWSRYVSGLDLGARFPGMLGLGIAVSETDGRPVVRYFAPAGSGVPSAGESLDLSPGRFLVKALPGNHPTRLVFAPLSVERLFASIPKFSAEEMVFDVHPADSGAFPVYTAPRAGVGQLVRTVPLTLAGRTFYLRWYRMPSFASSHDTTLAWVTTAISLIALALAAFVANLQAVRHRAEELARSMAKMSTLGEMAGGIAHEINNPLTVIGVTTAQLARDVETGNFDKEAMSKKIERIDRTVKRITSIVQGLRVFSRSADSVQKQAVQIQDVVNNVTDLCHDRFRHNGVPLEVTGQLDVEVHASIVQIEQVLLNLLSNAFDAVQAASVKWVKLEVEVSDREVRLVVQDSGGPIPAAVVEKMMEPFYTTKELGKGTGLGLSISKGILASHGGQLIYDGGRKHTCFVMILPRPAAQGRAA